jgi:hypothetical protein
MLGMYLGIYPQVSKYLDTFQMSTGRYMYLCRTLEIKANVLYGDLVHSTPLFKLYTIIYTNYGL